MKILHWYFITHILFFVLVAGVTGTPIVDFNSNISVKNMYPMPVQFTDASIGASTWNWSFGDGRWFNTTDSSQKNPIYQYSVAGKYTVNLTVNDTSGVNTTSKSDFINLTSDVDSFLKSWMRYNNSADIAYDEMGLVWTLYDSPIVGSSFGMNRFFNNSNFTTTKSGLHRFSYATLNFSGNDFTIETWVYPILTQPNGDIISRTNNKHSNGWGITSLSNNNTYVFFMGNMTDNKTNLFTIPNKTWSHVVVERKSGTIYVYVNGILNATKSGMSGNFDVYLNEISFMFNGYGNEYLTGYLDESRISNGIARWDSNFTSPFSEYKGMIEMYYPDINLGSTFRFKVDPSGTDPVAFIYNRSGGSYNRTLQIQNITYTDYILGSVTIDPLYTEITHVEDNKTTYNDIQFISMSMDNITGILQFNITRPGGFSAPGTSRVSIIDWNEIYYNYSPPSNPNQQVYYTYGKVINASIQKTYPIHNFIATNLSYGDWNFTVDFIANSTCFMEGNYTTFTSSFTGDYPNRWNWSFGDGTFDNGVNDTVTHYYANSGLFNVSLTNYLWQNTSVSNSTTKINYLNITDPPLDPQFIVYTNRSIAPTGATFFDLSGGSPVVWNWYFGNGQTSTIQNPVTTYMNCGNYEVDLYIENITGFSAWKNVSNAVSISCSLTDQSRLNDRMLDTQSLVFIGALLILVAIIVGYIAKVMVEE